MGTAGAFRSPLHPSVSSFYLAMEYEITKNVLVGTQNGFALVLRMVASRGFPLAPAPFGVVFLLSDGI